MKKLILSFLTITVCFFSCTDQDLRIGLDANTDLSFTGTLETRNSDENILEHVNLKVSNGFYECTTSLPSGYGAGKLEIRGDMASFIDTTFFVIPAIYGPLYVLSGEYYHEFDGDSLEISREKNVGSVVYKLKLIK